MFTDWSEVFPYGFYDISKSISDLDIHYDNVRNNNRFMNINENFKVLGNVDIKPILDECQKITQEDWDKFTWRQEANPMHGASKSLAIIYDQDFRHFNTTKHELYERLNFETIIEPMLNVLEKEYGAGYIVRAVLVKLPAGCSIKPHVDTGGSYTLSHRIHLPLICDPDKVEYVVDDERRFFGIGEMFELNNMRTHAVHNTGYVDRTNLLFDFAKYDGDGWWWK